MFHTQEYLLKIKFRHDQWEIFKKFFLILHSKGEGGCLP